MNLKSKLAYDDRPNRAEQGSSILSALRVLELVATSNRNLTVDDIQEELQIPAQTALRLSGILEREGFLQTEVDATGLEPGSRLIKLSLSTLSKKDYMHAQRQAVLRKLSDDLEETCEITIPDGTDMVSFDRIEAQWPLRVHLRINERVSMHCTAGGKLYLSNLPSAAQTKMIAKLSMVICTPQTITDREDLKKALRSIRKTGTGTGNEERRPGIVSVAVPIWDHRKQFGGALTMHTFSARTNLEQALEAVPRLKKAAAELWPLMSRDAPGG